MPASAPGPSSASPTPASKPPSQPPASPVPSRGVVLVTGDSSGLGHATATLLAASGYAVYGASRDQPTGPPAWRHLTADVTDDASVRAAVAAVVAAEGRLDAVIHFAGVSLAGPVEETSAAEAQRHFDVNYFGTVRVIGAALPVMRRQGRGRLIVIGSIAGLIGLRYLAHYSAAKAALDGLVEALRGEVQPFGVEATIVHPGDYRTDISFKGTKCAASGPASPYAGDYQRSLRFYADAEARGPEPAHLARRILALLGRRHLPVRVVIGAPLERLGVVAKKLLPSRLFERLMAVVYGP